jgi:P4 family phage/plasmid primase-like protien
MTVSTTTAQFIASKLISRCLYDRHEQTWYFVPEGHSRWSTAKNKHPNLSLDMSAVMTEAVAAQWDYKIARAQAALQTDMADMLTQQKAHFQKHVDSSQFIKGVRDFVQEAIERLTANTLDRIKMTATELFDNKPNHFAFDNCVYDTNTMATRPIQPDDYIVTTTGYDFVSERDFEAEREVMAFIYSLFENQELTDYLLNLLATTICGTRRHHIFLIMTGTGSNGKTQLQQLLAKAFGNGRYFCPIRGQIYHQLAASADSACPGLMAIKGKRIVVTDEIPASNKLEESVVKQFTGGSEVSGRALYGAEQSFRPQALFMLSCNEIPEFKGIDGGLMRRLRVLPFVMQFVDHPTEDHHR